MHNIHYRTPSTKGTQKIEEAITDKNERTADAKAAELFNTNRTYVREAQKIKEENPEAFEKNSEQGDAGQDVRIMKQRQLGLLYKNEHPQT